MRSTISAGLLCLSAILLLSACSEERRVAKSPAPDAGAPQGSPFASGTVGAAISGYWVDMNGVRRWYSVMHVLQRHAATDSTYGLNLQMDLSSQLAPHVAVVEADSVLGAALKTHGMSARDFVVLTGVMNVGHVARQLADSLGDRGALVNVGPELLAFFRANRREIDSLQATLQ